ncbi:hypothetical protein MLD38_004077 [Melastoma candidum]|uniref:Uncharacterized protein n=1 Tax=Melastoma candidum TaxID=119954 RepID=A0ACB9S3T0_9MYRT|nr:hypothetical protein MLD38_004077 [Melastoma candidum]
MGKRKKKQRNTRGTQKEIHPITYSKLQAWGSERGCYPQNSSFTSNPCSTEWLRSDPRLTAVGLDLDFKALNWCIKNNISAFRSNESSRISLFHGNVLQPFEATLVSLEPQELIRAIAVSDQQASTEAGDGESDPRVDLKASGEERISKTNLKQIPGRDILCFQLQLLLPP